MQIDKYYNLGKKLFKMHRSITGKGTLASLRELKKFNKDLKIKYFKTNHKVFDWSIPSEWNIRKAYVLDNKKKKIIDFKKNNLHIVAYSQPTKKLVKKEKLLDRLHYLENQPNAIPYATSYYKDYWGFSLSFNDFKKIKKNYQSNERFYVNIDTKFKKKGKMHYGEIFIEGKSKEEVLISTYICHPSMANNELSGPLVSLALSNYFKKKKLDRSIRFLFLPETIGSIAYIKKNLNNLKKNVIGGYILSCIGDNRNYSYIKSKYPNSLSDLSAISAFKKLKIKFKNYKFIKSESDERRFNTPFLNLGLGSILRTKYHSYPEYHTSLDNFSVVTKLGLFGGYKVAKLSIENLLKKKIKKKRKEKIIPNCPISKFICEPNLGKRKLYPTISQKNNEFKEPHLILDFIQYSDGTNSLAEISKKLKISSKKIKFLNNFLLKKKLIYYL